MRKEKIIFNYIIIIDPAGIGKTGIIVYDVKQKYIYQHITIESNSDENAVENIYNWINKILELKNVLVIIENFQIRPNLKIKNVLSTPLCIGGLKALFKYKFNWPIILQEPNVRDTIKLNYKGNIKISEHELDAWKHLQYYLKIEQQNYWQNLLNNICQQYQDNLKQLILLFYNFVANIWNKTNKPVIKKKTTITKNTASSTIKKNVTKKEIVEKKREWINKIVIDVKIHSDPIKTKIVAKTAGGVEIDAGSAGCSWSGMNYTTLSIYEPNLLSTFLKLRKDDEIRVTGSIWNTLNKVTKKYFHCIRVEKFEIIKKVPRKRTKS